MRFPHKKFLSKMNAAMNDQTVQILLFLFSVCSHSWHKQQKSCGECAVKLVSLTKMIGRTPETNRVHPSFFSLTQGAIGILSAKTKLLDPSQLEQIEGRVQALGSRLNQLTEKKEAVVEADKDSKVLILTQMSEFITTSKFYSEFITSSKFYSLKGSLQFQGCVIWNFRKGWTAETHRCLVRIFRSASCMISLRSGIRSQIRFLMSWREWVRWKICTNKVCNCFYISQTNKSASSA